MSLEEKRKENAFREFGYRDVLLIGDVFQMPPASGLAPIVTTSLFQNNFEVFYLKENRRQEKILHTAKFSVLFVAEEVSNGMNQAR